MAQQGYGLTVPSSRQDVISALLNEYGNSFGRGDGPSALSPVPTEKDLPAPPPRSDSLRNKPLPAVQRAEQRMSMKFQLRVIEDAPVAPNNFPRDPESPRPRKKILYRSLSRDAKPPSLNLIVSNGSTAVVPPTPVLPALPARAQTFPISTTKSDPEDLPSPPPPPPQKSARRSAVQRKPLSLQQSRSQSDLARSDSFLSPGENRSSMERPATVEAVSSVKRKGLPEPAAKKFVGLAQLGAGPRGGKGGPLPPTSAPRKKSVDAEAPVKGQEENVKAPAVQQQRNAPAMNQMPPTPEEDRAPTPPRKVAIGLPSNPRAKGGAASPKHVRGKSSTGFSLLKAHRPAPPPPSKIIETLTPEWTPSPTLKPEQLKDQAISPVSPLPPPKEQRRPFSFEAASASAPAPQIQEQPKSAVPIVTPPSVAAPPAQDDSPIRPSSADLCGASPTASGSTPPTPSAAPASQEPETTTVLPVPEVTVQPSPIQQTHPAVTEPPSTPPPFAPLTRAPIPLPEVLIPAITPSHLSCYTSHRNVIWSNNTFQPMGCMICHLNNRERKWCCTWCQLRICMNCSQELCMVPGRNLEVYLQEREKLGAAQERNRVPENVLSAVYERDEDFS
ncbi:hypothetical protein HBI23_027680 [Parastagonospora nodorum]|nr:hypothetical protein HBI79_011380 [Parastagonospora nodorum]KAH5337970.1 hypothetical protein HBI12_021130 [Parastagonospora nodorum]KAH5446782.1 hypothetical protein HBI47_018580 [Parastagonospora nodorum]KAH5688956.1 hypothetical protein HBI23_027680 [Parastagonospora nodorum]KAH6065399.1 hypothetical protein HBI67_127470 [Parastagonospora nodorum]